MINKVEEHINENTQYGKNLTFIIENETYGIEIKFVRQIMSMMEITPIPDQPDFVKGIINLRGQIIPIIDVRLKFNKPEKEYDDRTCIIVLFVNDQTVGIIVDNVAEVITIGNNDISRIPEFNKNLETGFIRGIGRLNQKVVILLECSELVKLDMQGLLE